jgi:hypothetical protein
MKLVGFLALFAVNALACSTREPDNRPPELIRLSAFYDSVRPMWIEYCSMGSSHPTRQVLSKIIAVRYRHACGHEINLELVGNRCVDRQLECRNTR